MKPPRSKSVASFANKSAACGTDREAPTGQARGILEVSRSLSSRWSSQFSNSLSLLMRENSRRGFGSFPTCSHNSPRACASIVRHTSVASRSEKSPPDYRNANSNRFQGNCVRVSVHDAGTGFEPQAMDRLLSVILHNERSGLGIGFSGSRSIIENHSERLWATPNNGPGLTFSFRFPAPLKFLGILTCGWDNLGLPF